MDALFGLHGDALALRSARLSLLASNIANAATPGYRARDIDFDQALASASAGQSTERAERDASGFRAAVQASADGNTVTLPIEQALFAENAVRYKATLSFLESRVATVTRALNGE